MTPRDQKRLIHKRNLGGFIIERGYGMLLINGSRLAKLLVLLGIGVAVSLVSSGADAQEAGHGQIILNNQTSMTLDMRVDGRQACQSAANLTCTSEQKAGGHMLAAFHEGRLVAQMGMVLKEGATWTWTVAGGKAPSK
jgi:hypothetical protein